MTHNKPTFLQESSGWAVDSKKENLPTGWTIKLLELMGGMKRKPDEGRRPEAFL